MRKVAVIGAGAYAIALSKVLDRGGYVPFLYTNSPTEKAVLDGDRENKDLLPGVKIPDSAHVSTDMHASVLDSELVVIAVPSRAFGAVARLLAECHNGQPICISTKGIDAESGGFMYEVASEVLPDAEIGVLSGPGFAQDIAESLPTTVTIGGDNQTVDAIESYLKTDSFSIEKTSDIAGVSACGSFKNIYAIGAGITTSKGWGEGAHSMLVTKGVRETARICEAIGGRKETSLLACGIGDLTMTCMSENSRNQNFGKQVVEGLDVSGKEKLGTVEGYAALAGARKIIYRYEIEAPIIEAIYKIVSSGADASLLLDAIKQV